VVVVLNWKGLKPALVQVPVACLVEVSICSQVQRFYGYFFSAFSSKYDEGNEIVAFTEFLQELQAIFLGHFITRNYRVVGLLLHLAMS
jgi:hypothetical protein